MSLPWMKFHTADWRADPKLRMCSIAARGLWMEMLCLMHEAEPYGFLVSNGRAIASRQLAALAGISAAECMRYMLELAGAGVYSVDDAKRIYSRRMVKDKAKADRDKQNGKGGGNPKLKAMDNGGVNPPDKAKKPEARSQIDAVADDARERPSSGSLVTPEAVQLTDKLLVLAGHDLAFYPPGWGTAAMRVQAWLNEGWQPEIIVAVVKSAAARKSGGPASSVTYFERAIAEEIAKQSRPLPTVTVQPGETVNVQAARPRSESLSDVARRQAAAGIAFGPRPTGLPADASDAESRTTLRLLPQG